MKGESPMSGDVRFVKAAEGGAEARGSWKISFGDTVRVDPDAETSLTDVKVDAEKSHMSAPVSRCP
jgi:hypothetical protein